MGEGGVAERIRKLPNPPDFDIFDIIQGTAPQKTFDALERFEKAYHEYVVKVNDLLAALQPLHDLYQTVHDRYVFESAHTRLDRESGYVVSKPQQDFVGFLAWLDEELEKLLGVVEAE
jgi:hypothetical protein